MRSYFNPALAAFLQQIAPELLFGQVWIRREPAGFELRHEADRAAEPARLRELNPAQLAALAERTEAGAYRPLKSSPNLARGWRTLARDGGELELALQYLYPGAVADWFTSRSEALPAADFRAFTQRQTGMYRITALLDAEQAARVVRVGCQARFCLKRRLWSAEPLGPDPADEKSAIPCLEPCPLLLEFARKAMRIEQETPAPAALAPSDWAAICAASESGNARADADAREAQFDDPRNARRRELALAKLRERAPLPAAAKADLASAAESD